MTRKTVLVTGANGYIGNAVARAFVRAGWATYGLVRSETFRGSLETEEIVPTVGSIDKISDHEAIQANLPTKLDAIISTTEVLTDYLSHFHNTITLLRHLSQAVQAAGFEKPLVIFTSGCKDYGVGPHFHGDPNLKPHTEDRPINPPPLLRPRAENAQRIFDNSDVCRPVLVRPSNLCGRSGSYYGGFFSLASDLAKAGKPLVLPCKPNAVLQALHVDDCADAYVSIASHEGNAVDGQVFNISAHRYETVNEIARSLVNEYNLGEKPEYINLADWQPDDHSWIMLLIGFPQWTDSAKLRNLTGWRDVRPLFSEALGLYRRAYEASSTTNPDVVGQMKDQVAAIIQRHPEMLSAWKQTLSAE